MPTKQTRAKAQRAMKQGKSPSTAAGEFVHEEIQHVRQGKHGARSAKQAIAIGLSKARRAGVPLEAPEPGRTSDSTRRAAKRDLELGQGRRKARSTSRKRKSSSRRALKREPRSTASKPALSRQAKSAARRRSRASTASRSAQARRGSSGRKAASRPRRNGSSQRSASARA